MKISFISGLKSVFGRLLFKTAVKLLHGSDETISFRANLSGDAVLYNYKQTQLNITFAPASPEPPELRLIKGDKP